MRGSVHATWRHITLSGSQSLFTLVLQVCLHGYPCAPALMIYGALLRLVEIFAARDLFAALPVICWQNTYENIYVLWLSRFSTVNFYTLARACVRIPALLIIIHNAAKVETSKISQSLVASFEFSRKRALVFRFLCLLPLSTSSRHRGSPGRKYFGIIYHAYVNLMTEDRLHGGPDGESLFAASEISL